MEEGQAFSDYIAMTLFDNDAIVWGASPNLDNAYQCARVPLPQTSLPSQHCYLLYFLSISPTFQVHNLA